MFRSLVNALGHALGVVRGHLFQNDPSTPHLYVPTEVPQADSRSPRYSVVGWRGVPGTRPGTQSFLATQVYFTMTTSLNYLARLTNGSVPGRWAATENLVAMPWAGRQLNAYYDRSSLRFFYNSVPSLNKVVYSAESVDVVAHELGHAVLDGVRPDLWGTATMEVFAFHEAFGDIMAVATVLQTDTVLDQVLAETANDLGKDNCASRIGEELGRALFDLSGGRTGSAHYLRNVCNSFRYEMPETLPDHGPDDVLAKEPHNFSRVFSGAWYEAFSLVSASQVAAGTPPRAAVRQALDYMMLVLLKGVQKAPSTPQFLGSVCRAMLEAAAGMPERHQGILTDVFSRRNLIETNSAGVAPLQVAPPLDTQFIDPTVDGHRKRLSIGDTQMVVDLPLQCAAGECGEVTRACAHACVHYLWSANLIGPENDRRMFSVENGRLKRNFICCAFGQG